MKSAFFSGLVVALFVQGFSASAAETIPDVDTVAVPVGILSVTRASIRKSFYEADNREFFALVDLDVRVESNIFCQSKASPRLVSVVPNEKAPEISLVQECRVREDLDSLGFITPSRALPLRILLRVEEMYMPEWDPVRKAFKFVDGKPVWPKAIAKDFIVATNAGKKIVKVRYALATKEATVDVVDDPAAKPATKPKAGK